MPTSILNADPKLHQPELIDPRSTALFLDIDGTLLDIAPTPNTVAVSPLLLAVLARAQIAFGGAIAIVTGRCIADADGLLRPLKLAAAGVHGGELRRDPGAEVSSIVQTIDADVLRRLNEIALRIPGVIVEPKGVGVAVHYRLAPTRRAEIKLAIQTALMDSSVSLVVGNGRMVFEVLPTGQSKGVAIESLMMRAPFAGRRPVMIGDDAGDISAFEAATRRGGLGLRVAGEHFPKEISDFAGPAAVCAWLQKVIA